MLDKYFEDFYDNVCVAVTEMPVIENIAPCLLVGYNEFDNGAEGEKKGKKFFDKSKEKIKKRAELRISRKIWRRCSKREKTLKELSLILD